ncbi:matrix-remodeling-associated protein 7-like isoform X2 [Pristis pectinata]|uniref:matrix-remodeling-associated protein 7-like isoform X2 n=1 Tax=Pristis pectinata TaxID=685728 RepID=UPI00223D1103|nr:matrix-remodeling-associated protein 7-like isoform X2 [Pristis pectinata]XP_051888862.1 matrix-remodeling-associated protein 7-like isoform X2 [Pristis pectinata]
MEVAVDAYLAVPLLFTLLAVLVASLYLKFRASDASAKDEAASSKVDETNAEEKPKSETEDERKPEGVSEEPGVGEPEPTKAKPTVEEVGAADGEREPAPPQERGSQVKQEPTRPEEKLKEDEEGVESTKKSSEDGAEVESTKPSLPDVTDDLVDEYRPGKIQRSNYEKSLTKEQLEEEQRVELTLTSPPCRF